MKRTFGRILANICVSFHECLLFECNLKPTIYFRYFADTFATFGFESQTNEFFSQA